LPHLLALSPAWSLVSAEVLRGPGRTQAILGTQALFDPDVHLIEKPFAENYLLTTLRVVADGAEMTGNHCAGALCPAALLFLLRLLPWLPDGRVLTR
jgi:hypothetical protein